MKYKSLPIKKLLMEWRYPAQLGFYGKMDQLGEQYIAKFPDWRRSAIWLQLENKKLHRRAYFSDKRSFFEIDGPEDVIDSRELGKDILDATAHHLGLSKLERVGVRQWFAYDMNTSFPALASAVHKRFYADDEALTRVLNGDVQDISYVVDCTHKSGWKFNVRLGPMEKKQWKTVVAYEPSCFEADDAGETFEKFYQTIPDQFIYLDIDCYAENLTISEVAGFLIEVQTHTHQLAEGLFKLCKESGQ